METIKSILDRHCALYVDIDLRSQLMKVEEEKQEFYDSYSDKEKALSEFSDIIIALLGVSRFSISEFLKGMEFVNQFKHRFTDEEIAEKITSKMLVNEARKWIKLPDGTTRHIDE